MSGYAARRDQRGFWGFTREDVSVGWPTTGGWVSAGPDLSSSRQTPFANARHTGLATAVTDVTPGTLVTTGIS
jgi:hypothetical protein